MSSDDIAFRAEWEARFQAWRDARLPGYNRLMYPASPSLGVAAQDYRWLLDRGYAESAALKLVGDRFQLAREERMVLFRGVAPTARAAARRSVIARSAAGRLLLVDGHNQALAVMHYLAGRPVFLASDGLVRDAGGSHGRIARAELFDRAISLLASRIAAEAPRGVLAFFDAPIPKSAVHAATFRGALVELGVEAEARTESSADTSLREAPDGSLVATSDSAVVDFLVARRLGAVRESGCPGVYDAARATIERLRAESRGDGALSWLDMAGLLEETR
jgi:hypothetical protein